MATDVLPIRDDEARDHAARRQQARVRNFDRDVCCVLGLPFDALTMTQAVAHVRQAAFANTRCFISTPNLNFLIGARSDRAFRDSVLHSDLSLADGMPLIWMARLLGLPLRERVSGAGLFECLMAHPGPPVTVFFFGGPDGVAATACENLNARGGGLRCVGFESPGFGSLESISDAERIARINASGAQFVVVSLGAKKGQAWIERNAAQLTAPVLCHLGAVVNFAAGAVQRAPARLQGLGMEWLWRIKEEPALLRRYATDGMHFMRLLCTRVLPDALAVRLAPARPGADERPSLHTTVGTDGVTIDLAGAWDRTTLNPLREALSAAQATALPVRVSIEKVTRADSALIALLMLAHTNPATGARLRLRGASPHLARVFHRNGAEYLFIEPAAGEAGNG